jgi:hypothetical protein
VTLAAIYITIDWGHIADCTQAARELRALIIDSVIQRRLRPNCDDGQNGRVAFLDQDTTRSRDPIDSLNEQSRAKWFSQIGNAAGINRLLMSSFVIDRRHEDNRNITS